MVFNFFGKGSKYIFLPKINPLASKLREPMEVTGQTKFLPIPIGLEHGIARNED